MTQDSHSHYELVIEPQDLLDGWARLYKVYPTGKKERIDSTYCLRWYAHIWSRKAIREYEKREAGISRNRTYVIPQQKRPGQSWLKKLFTK